MRLLIPLLLLLCGCDQIDRAAMRAAGWETVVLSHQPFEVGPKEHVLFPRPPLQSKGDDSFCLVVKSRPKTTDLDQALRALDSALQGAQLSATVIAADGKSYEWRNVGPAWAAHGEISGQEELSACLTCKCDGKVPPGTTVTSIRVTSSKPLGVLGAYWQSVPPAAGPEG